MPRRKREQDVIILEQDGESGLKWLLVGGLLGAGLALLLAPASGEETREQLLQRARRLRHSAEDAFDELQERFDAFRDGDLDDDEGEDEDDREGGEDEAAEDLLGDGEEVEEEPTAVTRKRRRGKKQSRRTDVSEAREELERRVAAARSRRRSTASPDQQESEA